MFIMMYWLCISYKPSLLHRRFVNLGKPQVHPTSPILPMSGGWQRLPGGLSEKSLCLTVGKKFNMKLFSWGWRPVYYGQETWRNGLSSLSLLGLSLHSSLLRTESSNRITSQLGTVAGGQSSHQHPATAPSTLSGDSKNSVFLHNLSRYLRESDSDYEKLFHLIFP